MMCWSVLQQTLLSSQEDTVALLGRKRSLEMLNSEQFAQDQLYSKSN